MGVEPNTTPFVSKYPVVSRPNGESGGIIYTIFIFDEIGGVADFAEVISVLDTAAPEDTIIFKINSPGGYANTTISIVDAIFATEAETIAECSGTVASAATIISLACSGLYIAPHTTFMCHNYTGGVYGKGHEIVADIEHSVPNNKSFVETMYKEFLTKNEIKKLLKGEDYYYTAEQVRERWLKVVKYREQQITKAAQKEQKAEEVALIEGLEEAGYTVTKK